VAVELKDTSVAGQIAYYLRGQAPTFLDYLLQGLLTTLFGWIPGLPGIGIRAIVYRIMLRMDGLAAIEPHVRIRHARSIRLGRGAYLDQGVYLHATPGGIRIGARTTVMHNSELHVFNFRNLPHAYISIGSDTFIGESVVIRGQGGVDIGNSVLIAPGAKILAVNHRFSDIDRPVIEQGITGRGIIIEEGAWIAAGAVVLDGVRVGRGAVVGANAVVTRDVPPHTLVAGSPARIVRDLRTASSRAPSCDRIQVGE
jgi:acetyltransferase-like isoleucine patch superfamily enzyme